MTAGSASGVHANNPPFEEKRTGPMWGLRPVGQHLGADDLRVQEKVVRRGESQQDERQQREAEGRGRARNRQHRPAATCGIALPPARPDEHGGAHESRKQQVGVVALDRHEKATHEGDRDPPPDALGRLARAEPEEEQQAADRCAWGVCHHRLGHRVVVERRGEPEARGADRGEERRDEPRGRALGEDGGEEPVDGGAKPERVPVRLALAVRGHVEASGPRAQGHAVPEEVERRPEDGGSGLGARVSERPPAEENAPQLLEVDPPVGPERCS